MKSLNRHQRLLLFVLFVLALTALLSPWFALAADWLADQWPAIKRYPFSRIFNRTFMISGIILFFCCRKFLKIGRLSDLGIITLRKGNRDLIAGWLLAAGSMTALIVAMTVADVFEPHFRYSLSQSLSRVASALASGIFAGVLEEIFFRGILFKGLLQNGRPVRAFILANLFYSALHFVKPGESYFVDGFAPLAGFRHLFYTFTPFLEPLPLLPGMFGLFLIGVVLSYAFLRTGNLYLAIGLHAGWVFSLKSVRIAGTYRRDDLSWLFGASDPRIVSGVATWIGILIVLALAHWYTRRRNGLSVEAAPSESV